MNLFEGVRLKVSQSLENIYALICIVISKKTFILLLNLILIIMLFFSCEEKIEFDTHNKILFTSYRTGKKQLYMMNPDSTEIEQIVSGGYSHFDGKWSPEAEQIVCNTDEGETTAGTSMVVMDADGSDRRLIGSGHGPIWHPNGDRIIFYYWPGAEVGIDDDKLYSVGMDGKHLKVLSETYKTNYTISPDGKKIAFSKKQDSLYILVIFDYPEINNPQYIYTSNEVGAHGLNWSPNGKKIAFSKSDTNGDLITDIYFIDIDSSNVHKITNNITNMSFMYPSWSLDEEKIIFLAHTLDGTDFWYLFMVNSDGSNLHKLISDNWVTSCDWSK